MTFFEWLSQLTMKERNTLASQCGYTLGSINFAIHQKSGISEFGAQVIYETAFAKAGPTKNGGRLTHEVVHAFIREQRLVQLEKAREKARAKVAAQ